MQNRTVTSAKGRQASFAEITPFDMGRTLQEVAQEAATDQKTTVQAVINGWNFGNRNIEQKKAYQASMKSDKVIETDLNDELRRLMVVGPDQDIDAATDLATELAQATEPELKAVHQRLFPDGKLKPNITVAIGLEKIDTE